MKVVKEMMKKIRSNQSMDAENRWRVAELLATGCEKRGSIQDEKTPCRSGMSGQRK